MVAENQPDFLSDERMKPFYRYLHFLIAPQSFCPVVDGKDVQLVQVTAADTGETEVHNKNRFMTLTFVPHNKQQVIGKLDFSQKCNEMKIKASLVPSVRASVTIQRFNKAFFSRRQRLLLPL